MKTGVVVTGLALLAIVIGLVLWMGQATPAQVQNSPPDSSAQPQATQASKNYQNSEVSFKELVHGATKTISSDSLRISFDVPKDWTVTGGDNGAQKGLTIIPPGDQGIASPALSIIESTTWPRDPAVYHNGTEKYVDGTQAGFDTLRGFSDGTSERFDSVMFTKNVNTSIDGNPAVLVNSQTAPGVATEPYYEDVYWVRRDTVNWYVELFSFGQEYKPALDAFIGSIKLQ